MNHRNKTITWKNKIVIFGLEDLAQLAYFYLKELQEQSWERSDDIPVAFTVNKEYLPNNSFKDLPVIAFEEIEKLYPPNEYSLFAPIADNKLRTKIYQEGKDKGYSFYTYISPYCFDFTRDNIGENCFIFEGNNLQPYTKIGNNCILWSSNHLGHHSVVEDNCFLTSHVVVSGHCHISKSSYIGVNSTLRDGITIGENCIIGMGSVVTKSTESNKTYIGVPAKKKE